MSTSAYADPFDFDTHYPNPVETIGSLLATEKSSGNLFQLVSFDCKVDNGYTPGSATAVVVIDDNDVESFTKKFDKSNESMKKKFDKLEDHYVYTLSLIHICLPVHSPAVSWSLRSSPSAPAARKEISWQDS